MELNVYPEGQQKLFFFENYSKSIKILKKNIKILKLDKYSKIIKKNAYDISQFKLNIKTFDLIFLDPPFKDNKINELIEKIKRLKITTKNSLIIIHRSKKITENISKNLVITKQKEYGLSKIIFGKIHTFPPNNGSFLIFFKIINFR